MLTVKEGFNQKITLQTFNRSLQSHDNFIEAIFSPFLQEVHKDFSQFMIIVPYKGTFSTNLNV